jgi:phosphoribosyl-AMP cyclohydrolase
LKNNDKIEWKKMQGLVPTIVQDAKTGKVLTLAYSSRESLKKALSTGQGWYYSRKKQGLWMKGEESGNTQKVKKIMLDCDNDALLFIVRQKGIACHTGSKTCFFKEIALNYNKLELKGAE